VLVCVYADASTHSGAPHYVGMYHVSAYTADKLGYPRIPYTGVPQHLKVTCPHTGQEFGQKPNMQNHCCATGPGWTNCRNIDEQLPKQYDVNTAPAGRSIFVALFRQLFDDASAIWPPRTGCATMILHI
jgi:hypothetical protein